MEKCVGVEWELEQIKRSSCKQQKERLKTKIINERNKQEISRKNPLSNFFLTFIPCGLMVNNCLCQCPSLLFNSFDFNFVNNSYFKVFKATIFGRYGLEGPPTKAMLLWLGAYVCNWLAGWLSGYISMSRRRVPTSFPQWPHRPL